MNCAEFQKALPYIMESGGDAEEEKHLRSCPVCSDLVADLRYIADTAKMLLPMEDPGSRVWHRIEAALQQEGLARRPSEPRLAALSSRPQASGWWPAAARVAAVAAAVVLVVGLFLFADRDAGRDTAITQPSPAERESVGENAVRAAMDSSDQELLAQLSPSARDSYEQNLKAVNAYIQQAESTVREAPENDVARAYLMQAYEQKSMLYEMAISRSLQ